MSDRHHHLRLWILGTLVMMVTMGTLTGSLLRRWSDGSPVALATTDPLLVGSASLMVLILAGLWFRNGVQLWKAAQI